MTIPISKHKTVSDFFRMLLQIPIGEPLPEIEIGVYLIPGEKHEGELSPRTAYQIIVHPGNEFMILGEFGLMPKLANRQEFPIETIRGRVKKSLSPQNRKALSLRYITEHLQKKYPVLIEDTFDGHHEEWTFSFVDYSRKTC